ncbi:hypothetical protein BDV93DRAFT_232223 [Ceratobasidium sp. AG-I]|nr:hypothetical protein BDV93DRAFT_232223 [Ceratobasidium sp. AG-I]
MNQKSQAYGVISSALQQWVHARIQFSKAIQAYISATTFLESTCTPFSIKSIPEIPAAVESNLKIMERDQFDLHRTQAALKRKRNSCMSPIYALPAEILAIIFTAAVPSSCFDSSEELVRKNLSHVCSHWRQVALEVCPVWRDVSLALKVDNTSDGKLMMAEIGLNNTYGWEIHAPIHHPPSASNTQYIQIALDTITPYIKRLGAIDLNTDSVEQLRPFLNLWLEKGSLRSVRKLYLSAKTATLVFPETNMRLSDRFSQCLRRISNLFLCSVGLDWSSVAFDRLRAIRLVGLPLVCCPSVVQLARVLSTCPGLWSLDLEHITFPASSDATPEPVELRCLQYICLKEVDISSVLVVISAKSGELVIELRDIINDDMLEALLSFARRSSISKLALTLSDTRSDQALSRLLHPVTSPLLGIQRLTLGYMSLRDSELNDLATHSFDRNDALLSSVSIVTTIQPRTLELWICTINTTPEALRDAIFTYPWQRLTLSDCYHSAIMQGADGATEVSNQINSTSDFGIRLNELIPGRAEFQ